MSENQNLRKKIKQLREMEINSDKTKEQIAEEILEMKENLMKFRDERKRVERAMEGMDREGRLMVLENDTMEGYVTALVEDKKKWKLEKSQMKKEILQLQVDVEEARAEVSAKEGEIGVLLNVNREKEALLEEAQGELRKAKETHQRMRKDFKKQERQFAEQVGVIKGELEDLRDLHEETRSANARLTKQLGKLRSREEYKEALFDRVLEKASLIMSRRLQILEKTIFMSKVGQRDEWKQRQEDAQRALREIQNGKFKQLSGVVEYLSLGRGSGKGDWAQLIQKDRQDFLGLACRLLTTSASEAVLKNKMKEVKEENDLLKVKKERGKLLGENLKKVSGMVSEIVERVEQKKVFSKGWKEQMDSISVQLAKIHKEFRQWNKPVEVEAEKFDMLNFFRNLRIIKRVSQGGRKGEQVDPREFRVFQGPERDEIGHKVRKLMRNDPVITKNDLIGELKDARLGKGIRRVTELEEIEMKQMLSIAENCNEELLTENKRLKVVEGKEA